MNDDLNKFKKIDSKVHGGKSTSILLFDRHFEFLKKEGLNLSALVRDYLDKLITDEKKENE